MDKDMEPNTQSIYCDTCGGHTKCVLAEGLQNMLREKVSTTHAIIHDEEVEEVLEDKMCLRPQELQESHQEFVAAYNLGDY